MFEITGKIVGAAIDVHRELGPGLLESAYEECLAYEMGLRGLEFERQKPLALVYKDVRLDCGYRPDFVVDKKVLVETKVIEAFHPIHQAQMMSYMKLGGWTVGLLINFNELLLTNGIKRVVLNYQDPLRPLRSLR